MNFNTCILFFLDLHFLSCSSLRRTWPVRLWLLCPSPILTVLQRYLNATAVVWRSPPRNDTITWTATSRKRGQWWRHNNEVMVERKVCFIFISSYFLADERFFTRYESVWQMSTTTKFTITSRDHHSDSPAPRRRVKSTTGTKSTCLVDHWHHHVNASSQSNHHHKGDDDDDRDSRHTHVSSFRYGIFFFFFKNI